MTKLRRVQRLGLLAALPSFPGTPTAGLELMADIMPIELFLEKTAITTLIRTNPTREQRSFSSKGDHISSLRKKANDLKIDREQVDRTKCHILTRSYITNIENSIPAERGWEIFTDGSKMGTRVGFGVSITEDGNEIKNYAEPLDEDNTVYLAELRAINCALSWCLKNKKELVYGR